MYQRSVGRCPTDKQVKTLEAWCLMKLITLVRLKKLLDRLSKRRDEGLTTPKQIRFLENKGFNHVGTWEFEHAKKLIDRIAANSWRVPRDINPKEYVPPINDNVEVT